ncbi:pentapeptide repeat-containing protein [Micromonospora rifamycinica]|uniref:pentapeptide repeat-containing protein n=1 Tax=Micromonospora rifamycinica TaxID=291594 RepID=UPI0033C76F57
MLLVAVGLYLTNDFNRDQYRLQQDSTKQQEDLALKGQRADRFVRAIDQLGQEGNEKLSIRLGGVYALETLMRESPEDRNTIIEVLCAFIRTHALLPRQVPRIVPPSTEDIRATLSVLGRRPDPHSLSRLDLSSTLLGLSGINLLSADLTYANLTRSNLESATLKDADMAYVDLRSAYLRGADLTNVNLTNATMQRVSMAFAILVGAVLTNAKLANADLTGSNLSGANLSGANLTNANLTKADLSGADLTGAHLRGANLTGAYLNGVNLKCTTMNGATKLPPGIPRSQDELPIGCQR